MSGGQIVTKNLEDFQGALDEAIVFSLNHQSPTSHSVTSYPTKILAHLCHDTRE